jgi:DNA adenine methylase
MLSPAATTASRSRTGPARRPGRPFLKWAGGKGQLLEAFASLYPPAASVTGYHEPFLGSGAVFFDVKRRLSPRRIALADSNGELIETYQAIRDQVDHVIRELQRHARRHGREHYYEVRDQRTQDLFPAARAARLIYLNRTCFNGLYRVNSSGQFNVPMGRYVNPTILDADNLRAVNACLQRTRLATGHFREVLDRARPDDFIYFDPPYVPVSATANFTGYTRGAFGPADQEELAAVYRALDARGCRLMLSNSDTPAARRLYTGFRIERLNARRAINSKAERRGPVGELVVLNYS